MLGLRRRGRSRMGRAGQVALEGDDRDRAPAGDLARAGDQADRAPSPVRTYAAWSAASGRTDVRPSSRTVTCGATRAGSTTTLSTRTGPSATVATTVGVAGEGERPLRLDHVRLAVDLEPQHRALDHREQPVPAGEGRERTVGVDVGQADPPRAVVGTRQLARRTAAVGPRLRGDVVDAHDGTTATSCPTSPWAAWSRARRRRPPAAPRRSRCSSSASCRPSASPAACACG